MALTIRDQSILLDTQGQSIDDWINIKKIRWENPTAVGHLMTLHDKSGKEIITMICATANQDEKSDGPGWVHGVDLQDLDSGEVRLFV
jgi:hypothetical protein